MPLKFFFHLMFACTYSLMSLHQGLNLLIYFISRVIYCITNLHVKFLLGSLDGLRLKKMGKVSGITSTLKMMPRWEAKRRKLLSLKIKRTKYRSHCLSLSIQKMSLHYRMLAMEIDVCCIWLVCLNAAH